MSKYSLAITTSTLTSLANGWRRGSYSPSWRRWWAFWLGDWRNRSDRSHTGSLSIVGRVQSASYRRERFLRLALGCPVPRSTWYMGEAAWNAGYALLSTYENGLILVACRWLSLSFCRVDPGSYIHSQPTFTPPILPGVFNRPLSPPALLLVGHCLLSSKHQNQWIPRIQSPRFNIPTPKRPLVIIGAEARQSSF